MSLLARLLALIFSLAAVLGMQAADARADFLKLIERPRVRLAAQTAAWPATNGIAQWHFAFASERTERVPGVLMKLENSRGRRPVVIALHGTGGSKANMLALCRKLATNGFVAVAID